VACFCLLLSWYIPISLRWSACQFDSFSVWGLLYIGKLSGNLYLKLTSYLLQL
jgi:hypothetical protein